MPLTIINRNAAKTRLIHRIAIEWMARDPAGAREAALAVKEFTKADIHKNGKCKGGSGYISVRMPSELWQMLRIAMPGFGNDDRDLRLLSQEFPDLILCRK